MPYFPILATSDSFRKGAAAILSACCLACAPGPAAASERVEQALKEGMPTKEFLDSLTAADIPERWRAQKMVKEDARTVRHIYSRDGTKRLEVVWLKEWVGDKEKLFTASIFDGDRRLARIGRLKDAAFVTLSGEPKDYRVIATFKDDGTVSVSVLNPETGFTEEISVQGRHTCLGDDLEYTKGALFVQAGLGAKPSRPAKGSKQAKPRGKRE